MNEELIIPLTIDQFTDDYEETTPNSKRAIDQAEKEGLLVVFPADNELQIDIDSAEAYATFKAHRDIVDKHVAGGIAEVIETPSKSGTPGKKHVTVKLRGTVTMLERILLQACLGSDRKRDLLSYVQVLLGDPHPVLFLEKKPN